MRGLLRLHAAADLVEGAAGDTSSTAVAKEWSCGAGTEEGGGADVASAQGGGRPATAA